MFFKIADSVFQTLKGFGYTLTLFDTTGQKVLEPSLARRIFCDPDKFMVSINELGANSEIKVYLSDSFDIKENANLIQTLRSIANHWNLLFSIRKYGKQLEPKMFAFMATPIREGYEGDWYGSTRSSYRKCYDSKIIIRHSERLHLEENEFVDRKSQIKKMYLETAKGERILVPGNSFALARGMAAYFASGGRPIDEGFRRLCQIHEINAQLKTCRKKIALENEFRPVVESLINEFSKSIKHSFNKNKINDVLESFSWIQRVSDNKKTIENVNNAEDYLRGLMEMKSQIFEKSGSNHEKKEATLDEADGVKLRRGWEIDPKTGEPKFVGTKRDRDRIARGEAPRDARLRGTLPVKLEPREKKKDPTKDLPVTPKALEIQKFLTDVYNITGGGDISDEEMLNQAKRITAGQIKLVNPATMDRPKIADSSDGKMAKMVWNLSEISQRLGVHDLVLANILSRIADAFETEMSGKPAPFNLKDARVMQLVKFVITKFKNDIMEKKATFPEMLALTEWFAKFAPESIFETKKKGR